MAQKTICDRCKKEIPSKKGRLVKHEVEFSRVEERPDGSQSVSTTLKAEICSACRAEIGAELSKMLCA